MKKSKKINHLIRLTCLAGAVFCYSAAGYAAVMSNTALPDGGSIVAGSGNIGSAVNNVMNITDLNNAVIKWQEFNIGSIATVNFSGSGNESFNVLNYVAAGGSMSQIHGTLNAQGGNVYLVNPAGVFIGKSAQIDVGSLYVSNKKIDALDNLADGTTTNQTLTDLLSSADTPQSPAELMSLGHINASRVTFDGDRIVLDTEHLTQGVDTPIGADNINIISNNKDNVVLGYVAYKGSEENQGYIQTDEEKETKLANFKASADGKTEDFTKADGYMWVEDVEQLQAINTNLSGNYALRNGIDATNTAEKAFEAIGSKNTPFTGKLDGLAGRVDGVDFSIFDLHVGGDNAGDNQGLFGVTNGATLKNLIFVSGSTTSGGSNIGTLVGSATGGVIENIKSSANVTGGTNSQNVGGIVGGASGVTMSNLLNTGAVTGHENVGGIVGSLTAKDDTKSTLTDARNIGQISGIDIASDDTSAYSHNIGGIAGSITGAALSNVTNDLTVSGGYNVGGIAGSMKTSSVTDATNTADITATGYTTEEYYYHTANTNETNYEDGIAHKAVQVANAGGIAGSSSDSSGITEAVNSGDVKTVTGEEKNYEYYIAGNVGGIVGRAEDTAISSVENKENHVFGAHNVGGIAGYLGGKSSIAGATNNGGEIMATGARNSDAFVKELIRGGNLTYASDEEVIIGNIGGIAGYMYGDAASITGAGNRGLVHSEEATDASDVPDTAKAANVGGVVGKIDRDTTKTVEDLSGTDENGNENLLSAAVSNSYNTGEVYGYTGIGGIAGMMYNGEIASSYNLGTLHSNYQVTDVDDKQEFAALNMGGIVGDTTENTGAKVLLYDVYNKGQIGDNTYTYYGRHVGGIVGRLSGNVEKAYNTGEIFNASTATGGIVGWWYDGDITNVFNTGNVTVVNKSTEDSRVGGIVGAVRTASLTLENAYNLGTIRSIRVGNGARNFDTVSGIVGRIMDDGTDVNIKNVYTVGNIYAGFIGDTSVENAGAWQDRECAIVGLTKNGDTWVTTKATIENAFYIAPAQVGKIEGNNNYAVNGFVDLSNDETRLNGATVIAYENRFDKDNSWGKLLLDQKDADGNDIWRMYTYTNADGTTGTTPILNAFMPDSVAYFGKEENDWSEKDSNITNVQYGTAYDPLLTIVEMKDNSTLNIADWVTTGIKKNESLAVYGGGLSIAGFANATESNYYGGLIYADGALSITSDTQDAIRLGSASQLYGSSVTVQNSGDIISYGSITAHGKQETQDTDGTSTTGNISISGANVELIGEVVSIAQGETLTVDGIWKSPKQITYTGINQWKKSLESVGTKYAYEVTSKDADGNGGALRNGNISITATAADGEVKALLGNRQTGIISSGGSISFTGSSVYVDSDLSFGSGENDKLTIAADEAVLDISNIGKVQTADSDKEGAAVAALHAFLAQGAKISFTGKAEGSETDAIIVIDMWDDAAGKFDLNQYDITDGKNFAAAIENLGNNKDKIHIWLDNAEQLQGINEYYTSNTGTGILSYNFALKNNIDANSLENFHGIGYGLNADTDTDTPNVSFTGTLDGRGYDIIGLHASSSDNDNNDYDYVGLFSRIGEGGVVKNLNIISSSFDGGSVGAVAGRNEGTIENVTTFGNIVTSTDAVSTTIFEDGDTGEHYVGAAGGITGINQGSITSVTSSDTVIAGITKQSANEEEGSKAVDSTAGGIVGVNAGGTITDSIANTAVVSSESANSLGGIAGINYGKSDEKGEALTKIDTVESLGVINGFYKSVDSVKAATNNVGGIVGANVNGATITNAYNEAHISGANAIGGVVGYVGNTDGSAVTNTIENVVNAGIVNAGIVNADLANDETKNTGGLVGSLDQAELNNARNVGTVTGVNNVGGIVGTNGEDAELKNIVNNGSATIVGKKYVGGIAGVNDGNINADPESGSNITNEGTIHGQNYVGGIAGLNNGEISNTISNITLYVKDANATGEAAAKYFGGVAGQNLGTISNATNNGNVFAFGATYVGGIAGVNGDKGDGDNIIEGTLTGALNSNSGTVIGANYVGGIAGVNYGEVIGLQENPTEIRNDGTVWAQDGGAGGVYAINYSDLEYKQYINSGTVIGQYDGNTTTAQATGGVIGENYGDITYSDLINEADSIVVGKNNVGGLIGINYGTVAGERDEGDNYYAYQVYNNGTVLGAEINEELADNDNIDDWESVTVNYQDPNNTQGVIEKTVYYKASADSSNIGGLIGSNAVDNKDTNNVKTGSLTAAYNTGKVSGGTNVGGIVGSNSGTVDQVFNAGEVEALADRGVVGTVVGVNNGNASNAYDVNKKGTDDAIGSGVDVEIQQNAEGKTIWKTYGEGEEYGTNKLLSVFLTKIKFEANDNFKYFIYNAQNQGFVVKADGDTVNVYVCNVDDTLGACVGEIKNVSDDENAAHSLADYLNTLDDSSMSNLLMGTVNKDAGNYEMFTTQQINTAGDSPNNLGYDIVQSYSIDKATLSITLDDITRVYGNDDITNKNTSADDNHIKLDSGYGYTIASNGETTDELLTELKNAENFTYTQKSDGAVDNLTSGKTTNDVGNYDWSADFVLSEDAYRNYSFADDAKQIAVTGSNNSEVTKAQLTVTLNDVSRVYGNEQLSNGYSYGGRVTGLVNGDMGSVSVDSKTVSDGALATGGNGRVTNDVSSSYTWSVGENGLTVDGFNADNYNITVEEGKSAVTKAELELTVNNASIKYGDAAPTYGYTVVKDAVNGDTLENLLSVDYATDGILDNGRTNIVGEYDITGTGNPLANSNVNTNYNVTINNGKLTIGKADLNVTLNDVSRVYGSKELSDGYSYSIKDISGWKYNEGESLGEKVLVAEGSINDTALTGDESGRITNDVNGGYSWNASVAEDRALDNYNITVEVGKSEVTKAQLVINVSNAETVYGTKFDESKYGYSFGEEAGLVNGDSEEILGDIAYTNRAAKDGTDGKWTDNAGEYEKAVGVTLSELSNYNVTINKGDAKVDKAQLTVNVNDQTMTAGGEAPAYTGSISGIVNGDTETGLGFGGYSLDSSVNTATAGVYADKIGVLLGGKLYLNVTDLSNYSVSIAAGTLTVNAAEGPNPPQPPVIDPTKPIKPGDATDPRNPDVWQAADKYPWQAWDKQRNERERKAEVHFVDGGMAIH